MMKHYASLDFLTRCCCSVAQSCLAICNRMDCSTPGFPVIHHLQDLAQTHVHQVSDAIQPSHSLSSLNPPAFNLSQQRFFERFFSVSSNESALRWPKYWSFSFRISPSKEYSGLLSFRIDWFDLLAIQGTLKSLLQHHSSKVSILWRSALFILQLSYQHMTTGKTIALTFVIKVISLLFNTLSRIVITFIPRSKRLLISWLQSPSTVTLEPKKRKSLIVIIVSPSICNELMGPDAMIFVFEC